jgi:hypothetical protein
MDSINKVLATSTFLAKTAQELSIPVSTLTFKRPMSDICDGTTTLLTAE